MKKRVNLILSAAFFVLGVFFIINSKANITGAVIGISINSTFSLILGIAFVFVSVILFIVGKEDLEQRLNEAGIALQQRRIYTKRNELIRLAIRCGYELSKGRREGTLVKDPHTGAIITVISDHPTILYGTSRGIMRALATGQSSYRRRNIYLFFS